MKRSLFLSFILVVILTVFGCKKNPPTSPMATNTPDVHATQTQAAIETMTATCWTSTNTSTITPTATITNTFTITKTNTVTPTVTITATQTDTSTMGPTPLATSTHTADNVSGTLILPASQQGRYYWVGVYTAGQIGNFVSDDIGICPPGTSVPFSMYVSPGTGYGIIAIVNATGPDVLGHIGGPSGPPRPGDYFGQPGTSAWPTLGPSFDAPATGVDIQLSVAPANLQGTITLPSAQPGKMIAIEVTSGTKGTGGKNSFTYYDVLGSSATYNYSICAFLPDTYYIFGFVDVVNNSHIENDMNNTTTDAGNYLGYYGGSGVNPPGAGTALNFSPANYLSFSLGTK